MSETHKIISKKTPEHTHPFFQTFWLQHHNYPLYWIHKKQKSSAEVFPKKEVWAQKQKKEIGRYYHIIAR